MEGNHFPLKTLLLFTGDTGPTSQFPSASSSMECSCSLCSSTLPRTTRAKLLHLSERPDDGEFLEDTGDPLDELDMYPEEPPDIDNGGCVDECLLPFVVSLLLSLLLPFGFDIPNTVDVE